MTLESEPPGAPFQTGLFLLGASWLFRADHLFVAGGQALSDPPDNFRREVRCLSLADGALVATWPLHVPRYLHAEGQSGAGRVLLFGGLTAGPDGQGLFATPSVELLDIDARTSARLPDMPFATAEALAVPLPDGRTLVAGGYDEDVTDRSAILDADHRAWQPGPPLPAPRAGGSGPVRVDDRHVLFAGGCASLDGGPSPGALLLDVYTLTWTLLDIDLPAGAALASPSERTLLAAGGHDARNDRLATVTLWTWSD